MARAEAQRSDLEAEMRQTGQTDALIIAALERHDTDRRSACTVTTWIEDRTTVLPQADVVTLYTLPRGWDGEPARTMVRWEVLARVCGATCWQRIPDLEPARWITRRWPTTAELEIITDLAIPGP